MIVRIRAIQWKRGTIPPYYKMRADLISPRTDLGSGTWVWASVKDHTTWQGQKDVSR